MIIHSCGLTKTVDRAATNADEATQLAFRGGGGAGEIRSAHALCTWYLLVYGTWSETALVLAVLGFKRWRWPKARPCKGDLEHDTKTQRSVYICARTQNGGVLHCLASRLPIAATNRAVGDCSEKTTKGREGVETDREWGREWRGDGGVRLARRGCHLKCGGGLPLAAPRRVLSRALCGLAQHDGGHRGAKEREHDDHARVERAALFLLVRER
eukprot:2106504-Pleurochrysis_carterae.AAC.1